MFFVKISVPNLVQKKGVFAEKTQNMVFFAVVE